MGPALSCAAPFSALGTLTSRPGRPAPWARRCDCPAAGHQPRPRRAPAAGRRRSGWQILHLVYWLTRRAGAGSNRYRVDRGAAAPPGPAVGFLQAKLLRWRGAIGSGPLGRRGGSTGRRRFVASSGGPVLLRRSARRRPRTAARGSAGVPPRSPSAAAAPSVQGARCAARSRAAVRVITGPRSCRAVLQVRSRPSVRAGYQARMPCSAPWLQEGPAAAWCSGWPPPKPPRPPTFTKGPAAAAGLQAACMEAPPVPAG